MTNHKLIPLLALGLVLAGPSVLAGQDATPETLIGHARAAVVTPEGSRDAILEALIGVLDASLMILPDTDYAGEFRSRIEWVKGSYKEGVLFSDKGRQYLGLAYKLVSGGNAWQIPAELKDPGPTTKGIERATEICVKLLDSALAERKAGRNGEAVRRLLEFVLLVITPIEA